MQTVAPSPSEVDLFFGGCVLVVFWKPLGSSWHSGFSKGETISLRRLDSILKQNNKGIVLSIYKVRLKRKFSFLGSSLSLLGMRTPWMILDFFLDWIPQIYLAPELSCFWTTNLHSNHLFEPGPSLVSPSELVFFTVLLMPSQLPQWCSAPPSCLLPLRNLIVRAVEEEEEGQR